MPKIFLKPNSPEFAEKESAKKKRHCDMPGCALPGLHKAPKNRALDEYYKFCVDHVRDYNKAWNFFDGMADHEVEEHMVNALYGERPTWRYDNAAATEDILKRKAWQTYHFTDKAPPQDDKNGSGEYGRNTPEFKAMAVMGLEPPLSLDCIRQRYKELAKKHHPDLNRGCTKSEELLKEINMAYTILKLAFENFEKLPERP